MNTRKTIGIALKSLKIGEADKIITFLTPEGKVSAAAKGVRRPSSKFGGRLEPGNDLELVLARGRTLETVTAVQIRKARFWLRNDLDKLDAAYAMFELVDKIAPEAPGGDKLLELLAAALDRLEVESRLPLLLLAFDLKALALSGFLPNFTACVICGRWAGLNRVSAAEGGVICDNCYSGRQAIKIGKEGRELVRQLLAARLKDLDSIKAATGIIETIEKVLRAHIAYHVRADLKTRREVENSKR